LLNGPNGWCHCQSIQKALPQSVSKQYTLDEMFFLIATISNVLDLDGEHHTGFFPSHLQYRIKRNHVPFGLPNQWGLSHQIWAHPPFEGICHVESDGSKSYGNERNGHL
jgi:hypothetical protein